MAKKVQRRKSGSKKFIRRKNKRSYVKKVYRKKVVKKSYKKKFRSNKRKVARRFRRRSSVTRAQYKTEYGGTATADKSSVGQMLYVGHGLGGDDLHNTVFTAILKKLMAIYGVYYATDEQVMIDQKAAAASPFYTTELLWRYGEGEYDTKNTDFAVAISAQLRNHALSWGSQFRTDYLASVTTARLGAPQLISANLYSGAASGQKDNLLASLDLMRAVFHISHNSTIRFQNVTANEGYAGTGFASLDVLNQNPLSCKLYKGAVGKNYMTTLPKFKDDAALYRGWVCSGTGYCRDKDSMRAGNNFGILPGRKDVDCAAIVPFVLHPSQVVEDKQFFKTTQKSTTLMKNMFQALGTATFEECDLGKIHVIGFDKLLWDRTVTTDYNVLKIGFQVTHSYSVDISLRKLKTVPFVYVNSTAVPL